MFIRSIELNDCEGVKYIEIIVSFMLSVIANAVIENCYSFEFLYEEYDFKLRHQLVCL